MLWTRSIRSIPEEEQQQQQESYDRMMKSLPQMTQEKAEVILDIVKKCTVRKLNTKDLSGKWNLLVFSKEVPEDTEVNLNLKGEENKIKGKLFVNGQMTSTVNLMQLIPDKPGVLVNIFNEGQEDSRMVPVMVISYEERKWVTLWQGGDGNPETMDWAIYVRPGVENLSDEEYEKATSGLSCLGLMKYPDEFS
ncbi:hypothetical protein RDWZM_004311 [Blomia tropicalis]|uniref:Uncharacterized protein n=1 Tax=Blomia tropicalis TaxID=40697 RepID=A0A9Q0MGX9_BLOTA|nr:hypothetical protein RDWZM_004311 [Blomia tropicalis]